MNWLIWALIIIVFGLPVFNLLRLSLLGLNYLFNNPGVISGPIIFVHTHWLDKNGLPGKDFRARLDAAFELWKELGINTIVILTAGRHYEDKISLAKAGKDYLISKGIPATSIISTPEDFGLSAYDTATEVGRGSQLLGMNPNLYVVLHYYQRLRGVLLWWFRGYFKTRFVTTTTIIVPRFNFIVTEIVGVILTLYDPYGTSLIAQSIRAPRIPKD